jgi:Na+/proline symporter
MRRGFWWNVLAAVTAIGLLGLLGLAAHAHAALAGPPGDAAPPLAHLVRLVRSLPAGLTGVVAAGLLAATMSSIDSGIHACSTAWLEDWRPWLAGAGRGAVREESAALRRGLTAGFGVLATGMALGFIPLFGRHAALFPMVNKVLNGMGSPLLALILAALLSRRANAPGAFWGGLAGALLSAWTSFGVGGLALHLYAVINLAATWALIALASAAWRAAGAETTEAQRAWTWRAVMARGAPGGAPGADGTGDAGGD